MPIRKVPDRFALGGSNDPLMALLQGRGANLQAPGFVMNPIAQLLIALTRGDGEKK